MLGLVLLVLFVHFGGSNVPKVLKDNKQMVYGVTIGLVLCSFFGVKVEGIETCGTNDDGTICTPKGMIYSSCIGNAAITSSGCCAGLKPVTNQDTGFTTCEKTKEETIKINKKLK